MPTGFLGNGGDDVAVFALADHQGWVIGGIGLEMADSCKELLMPATQQNPAAVLTIRNPGVLIFDVKAKGPTVGADEVIQKTLNLSDKPISIFFQQIDPRSVKMTTSGRCFVEFGNLRLRFKTSALIIKPPRTMLLWAQPMDVPG